MFSGESSLDQSAIDAVHVGAGQVRVVVAGAAVGAAVALLYAPTTGVETRDVVNRRAREGREKMIEALRQGRGLLDRQREQLSTAFERAREQARSAAAPKPHDPGV